MPEVSEKLAKSLEALMSLQSSGVTAIKSDMLERADRERLVKQGFIKQVLRGWYIPSSTSDASGDSTSWYASFWDFCTAYLDERLESRWCLSPEQSAQIHIGDRTVPKQLLVRSPHGRNKPTELMHGTSVLDIKQAMPPAEYLTKVDGIRVYTVGTSLAFCSKRSFVTQPILLRTLLSMVKDASEVLEVLLAENKVASAGRLAGAFRSIGRDVIADNIVKGMELIEAKVAEVNPFEDGLQFNVGRREQSPYVNRLRLMWSALREDVIRHFPFPSEQLLDKEKYLGDMDDIFVTDAYHSLSIEGYRVTPDLIEHVRSGQWSPEHSKESQKHLDAMAAKGYWDAFQKVKEAVASVLDGANPGAVLERVQSDWYFALFGQGVAAGILEAKALAGYRTGPVYIRRSMHTPPNKDAVRDMMPVFYDLLIEEKHPAVRLVLGHFIFVYIHPYMDGNGRIGRFIMNLMAAAGTYPWIVIPVERRNEYMEALETASVGGDIVPFTQFVASLVR